MEATTPVKYEKQVRNTRRKSKTNEELRPRPTQFIQPVSCSQHRLEVADISLFL